MNLLKTTLAALILAVPLASFAQSTQATKTPRIDQRQANQEKRIQQGVQSGALTPRETARLDRGQNHVQAMENRARADGKVTPHERARILRAENRQSRRIFRQKHDNQHSFNQHRWMMHRQYARF